MDWTDLQCNIHYFSNFNITGSLREIRLACPGEQLVLTCIADQSPFLNWTITIPERNITHFRLVPFKGDRVLTQINETLNNSVTVTFSFTRTSENGTLPLVSTLMVESVYTDINRTELHCLPSNETDPSVTYIIHVQGGE